MTEDEIEKIVGNLADPALDSWVAMQDVGAEAQSSLGLSDWDDMDLAAAQILAWLDRKGLARIGTYTNEAGLTYFSQRGDELERFIRGEISSEGVDPESFRMDTMLSLTREGISWAQQLTGRTDHQIVDPAPAFD